MGNVETLVRFDRQASYQVNWRGSFWDEAMVPSGMPSLPGVVGITKNQAGRRRSTYYFIRRHCDVITHERDTASYEGA